MENVTLLTWPIAESESDDEKPQTAASHTYDKGYKRWEDFDGDAAADAVAALLALAVARRRGAVVRRWRLLRRGAPVWFSPLARAAQGLVLLWVGGGWFL